MGADRSELVAEGYEAALKLQRLLDLYPLAFRSLWHRPSPRTSQKQSVQALMDRSVKVGLLVGGNRSGKTESGAMIAAAVALGRGDAAVAKWMKDNGIPESSIFKRPGRVCCVSLTSNESIRVQRPKIEQFPSHDRSTRRMRASLCTASSSGSSSNQHKSQASA